MEIIQFRQQSENIKKKTPKKQSPRDVWDNNKIANIQSLEFQKEKKKVWYGKIFDKVASKNFPNLIKHTPQ